MTGGLLRGSMINRRPPKRASLPTCGRLKGGLFFVPKGQFFFALCLLLPLGLGLLSCENDIQTIDILAIGKDAASETMKDAEIIYSDSGMVKMKIIGPKLDRYAGEKAHIVFPAGVNMLFYDDSLKVNSTLKADYGIRYETEGGMEAKRNVEVVNVKGEKLNTEHLIWDEAKDRIYTEVFVKITRGNEVMYGDGLESNQDFTKYRIKNFKGTIYLNDSDTTENK